MCQFCQEHGEGKKWYLQAKNYSEDLLSDLERRKLIVNFFSHPEALPNTIAQLEQVSQSPDFIRAVMTPERSNRQKKSHFGQVLPIEDVERIFSFVTSVVRMACYCRQSVTGPEQRYCYAVSLAPQGGEFTKILRGIDASYLTGPDTAGLETLNKDEALASLHEHEQEGMCHTVWLYAAPFIGSICNCDADCGALRLAKYGMQMMFRAEYVAQVTPELCNGCRECMRICPFGAVRHSVALQKVLIDPRQCHGCGICRTSCPKDAITLYERTSIPVAANIW